MNNLKDFIKNKQVTNLQSTGVTGLPSTGEIKSAIMKDLSITPDFLTLTTSEKEQFTNKVTQVAKSDEVLTELSEALGKPKESESEEEFVKRGKSILANRHYSKISHLSLVNKSYEKSMEMRYNL